MTTRVPIQVDPEFKKKLRQAAAEQDLSMAEFTRRFCQQRLQKKSDFFEKLRI